MQEQKTQTKWEGGQTERPVTEGTAQEASPQMLSSSPSTNSQETIIMPDGKIDSERHRFPYCIVWCPIPCLTWLFPFIGHMGICMSSGVVRDFAGPYYVSEDNMAFGSPAKYWQLDPARADGGTAGWDRAVSEASHVYGKRMHNLCCDNCHSHVAMALNIMNYDQTSSWNMVKLCALMLVHGRYVSWCAAVRAWLPSLVLAGLLVTAVVLSQPK